MVSNSRNLFEPVTIGPHSLQNRLVMAPMTRSRAIGNVPNDLMATYYGQRSSAGLIVTEGTSPSPNGLGYPRIPGVFSEPQVAGWKKVTAAAHAGGAKIFVQLMHTGRVSHPLNLPAGARVLAPSPVAANEQMFTDSEGMQPLPVPVEMTLDDIRSTQDEFAGAASHAIEAGFDGIELHAANGYLLEQFLRPTSNVRDDDYGGPIENRARMVLEVAEKVSEAIGEDRVGIRLSPFGVFNDMPPYDAMASDYKVLARKLGKLGLLYLHLVDHSGMGAPEVPKPVKAAMRKAFPGALILSGNYDAKRAQRDLDTQKGDLVAVGRGFLANPDLPSRWQRGDALSEPDFDTFYTPGEKGYTDYAAR